MSEPMNISEALDSLVQNKQTAQSASEQASAASTALEDASFELISDTLKGTVQDSFVVNAVENSYAEIKALAEKFSAELSGLRMEQ